MRFAEFVRNSGSPVAYYPRLAIALGGVKEAVFVCQLLYWEGKQSDSKRWIHKLRGDQKRNGLKPLRTRRGKTDLGEGRDP